jgi:hypothetical protein
MGDHDALLRRYAPRLRYDEQETFFADHPELLMRMPGVELQAADRSVLARSDDGTLALERLADEASAPPGQRLSIVGRDYRERYAAVRQEHPGLRNHLVGRAVRDREGALWLQYWAWYVYNDYRLAANVGLHEGDWEMVQLQLDGDDPDAARPIYAVYAQHRHAERRAWDRVERDGDAPVVHVARGSHAAYFEPGVFGTDAWIDIADGRRPSPRSTLLIVDDATGWARWRGRWGDTEARVDGVESDSPDSPCERPHWTDPLVLLEQATEERLPRSAVPGPDFAVRRQDGRLAVSYDLRRVDPPPVAVLVTVNSHGEPGVPPRTATFDVREQDRKGVVTGLDVAADRTYEVLLSVVSAAGEPSAPVRRILDPGTHEKRKSLSTRIGLALAPLIGNLPGGGPRG